MKRVQLILEEWQHEWLAAESAHTSTSMSALLRQLLTEAIERRQMDQVADDPLWGVIGMASGPDDGITSENLDEFLYPATGQLSQQHRPERMAAESTSNYEPDHR